MAESNVAAPQSQPAGFTAVLAGSTGLTGSDMLKTLLSTPQITSLHAFTRRPLPESSPLLSPIQADISAWPEKFPTGAKLFLSGLGTTRAAAGSFEKQYEIDHDANLALAKAAKERGVETYVLISATGASASSFFAYPKMKGSLEKEVEALGFKNTIFVRPGLIRGMRNERRPSEAVLQRISNGLEWLAPGGGLTDFWGQPTAVIARAAVRAGIMAAEGKAEKEGVWFLSQADIVRLGKEA